jgi:hypothetical protein
MLLGSGRRLRTVTHQSPLNRLPGAEPWGRQNLEKQIAGFDVSGWVFSEERRRTSNRDDSETAARSNKKAIGARRLT